MSASKSLLRWLGGCFLSCWLIFFCFFLLLAVVWGVMSCFCCCCCCCCCCGGVQGERVRVWDYERRTWHGHKLGVDHLIEGLIDWLTEAQYALIDTDTVERRFHAVGRGIPAPLGSLKDYETRTHTHSRILNQHPHGLGSHWINRSEILVLHGSPLEVFMDSLLPASASEGPSITACNLQYMHFTSS